MTYRKSALTGAPTVTAFRDSFLLALGRAVCFQVGASLPLRLLIPATLKTFGIDLKNPEFPREGLNPAGLDQKIRILSWYLGRPSMKEKLTVKGEKHGHWGLTEAGVARALALDGRTKAEGTPNLTARWLEEKLTANGGLKNSPLYRAMGAAIASRNPVSAASQQVDDHISECLARLIHRDALRGRIMLGKKITNSHICTYGVRSAWTDNRNSATNPVCRSLYGARTETERKKAPSIEALPWVHLPSMDPRVQYTRDGKDMHHIRTITDENAKDALESLHFEDIWAKMLATIKAGKPKSYERYIEVLKMKANGDGAHDVAQALGVSDSRAVSIIAETRRVLRDAQEAGSFSMHSL